MKTINHFKDLYKIVKEEGISEAIKHDWQETSIRKVVEKGLVPAIPGGWAYQAWKFEEDGQDQTGILSFNTLIPEVACLGLYSLAMADLDAIPALLTTRYGVSWGSTLYSKVMEYVGGSSETDSQKNKPRSGSKKPRSVKAAAPVKKTNRKSNRLVQTALA